MAAVLCQRDSSQVVWAVARERFDDVADPVRKFGHDLLRFLWRCSSVHTASLCKRER